MKNKDKKSLPGDENMTRKEAMIKGGKYAAFTAAAMLTVLSPKESQAQSPAPAAPPAW